jgi:nicotinamidase/pyrazinamidase
MMRRYGPGTALVVTDVQNDFADPRGGLYVAGGEDVVAAVNREVIAAVAAGSPVVYTKDWHPETTPHFAKDGGVWPVHCVAGTWGAEFHPRLVVAGPTVLKGANGEDGYSGFTMRDPESGETVPTTLAPWLAEEAVERIVVVGLALDYCVKETALDGVRNGFSTGLLVGATAAVDLEAGDGDRATQQLRDAGVVIG